jgi:myo-inositol-1(or 4)-monophosphatase
LPAHDDQVDLELLQSSVRAAGDIAKRYFGQSYKRWSKEGGSPVTEADLAIDAFLKEQLTRARPAYGWLSEESSDDPARLKARRTFVVDPIDGTVAFLKGKPHFTICAAVVMSGRPRAAIVFNPIRDEWFCATLGGGAHKNGVPIAPSRRDHIEGCRMLGSRTQFEGWPAMDIVNYASLAYRVVLVAAGDADAAVSLKPKRDWDLAAADLILWEAGGKLTDAAGQKLIYNRPDACQHATIAAGPLLHGRLLAQAAQKAVGHGADSA